MRRHTVWPPTFEHGETLLFHQVEVVDVDEDGAAVHGETTLEVPGCAVWPAGSSEDEHNTTLVTDSLVALIPPRVDVTAVDEITRAGRRYRVDGKPFTHTSPLTGHTAGTQLTLKATT